MNVDVVGRHDLVNKFGSEVQTICKCKATNKELPFSRIALIGSTAELSNEEQNSTLRVVVYGSSKYLKPCVPWQGQLRYQNNWEVALPIFDDQAQPIAELVGDSLLFILIPLSEDQHGKETLRIILSDAVEILTTQGARSKIAEDLLMGKLPEDIGNVVALFKAFCGAHPQIGAVGEFDKTYEQTSAAYDRVIEQSQNVLRSFVEARIAGSLQKLKISPFVKRSFFCRGVLFIESCEVHNKVLKFYWNPGRYQAQYEVSGLVRNCDHNLQESLRLGYIYNVFVWLVTAGIDEQDSSGQSKLHLPLNLELISQNNTVQTELASFRKQGRALYELAQKECSITGFMRRWYLVSQALALRTMTQFSKVEFQPHKIVLSASDVTNTRSGSLRLGEVGFGMFPDHFELYIENDRRCHKCAGDAGSNYKGVIKEGHLVAAAEILWQHVTVG